jgi:hypothetical protein
MTRSTSYTVFGARPAMPSRGWRSRSYKSSRWSGRRDGVERRQHVAFDGAAVDVVGAVGEHESLAGQPTGRQVGTERH